MPVEIAKLSVVLLAAFLLAGLASLLLFPPAGAALLLLGVIAYRAPAKFLDYAALIRRKKLESEMPFALRYFAQLLDIGLTPESALSKIASMDFGGFSRLLSIALDENRKGKMLEKALRDLDREVDSEKLRETTSVVIQTLRLGPSEDGNRISLRLARRMMEERKGEYERFAAKSQVLMVVQVVVSAIVPAVVAVFASFGSFLSGPAATYLLFFFLLPAASIAGLIYLSIVHPG